MASESSFPPPFLAGRHDINNISVVIIRISVGVIIAYDIAAELIEIVVIVVDVVVHINDQCKNREDECDIIEGILSTYKWKYLFWTYLVTLQ